MSLSSQGVGAVIAVSEMDRATELSEGRLGLTAQGDDPDGDTLGLIQE
jgi:hypothetical protein